MNFAKRKIIFQKLAQKIQNPTTELEYKNSFELLIAVILSAQSTDKQVNIATKDLFKKYDSAEKMLALSESKLKEYIKNIGLYNSKAKNILKTCQKLINDFDGKVPNTREELESLFGVGRKTANVILNTFFNQPTIAVDTHIFRISNRIGLAKGKNEYQVEMNLMSKTPKEFLMDAHHLLILHGRYTCKAIKPDCKNCVIFDECEWNKKQK